MFNTSCIVPSLGVKLIINGATRDATGSKREIDDLETSTLKSANVVGNKTFDS